MVGKNKKRNEKREGIKGEKRKAKKETFVRKLQYLIPYNVVGFKEGKKDQDIQFISD